MSDIHVNGPVVMPTAQAIESTIDSKPGLIFNETLKAIGVYNTDEIYNPNAKGVRIHVFVTGGAGSVAVKTQVKDPASGTWSDIVGGGTAAIAAGAGGFFTIYPGLTGIADVAGDRINTHIGPQWRIVATVTVNTCTFTVGAQYLL